MWWKGRDSESTSAAPQRTALPQGRARVGWLEFWAQLAACFQPASFVLGIATDKLKLFRLGYLADTFLQMNKVSLSLQGKQLTVCAAKATIQAFRWKLEFWKTCMSNSELDSFLVREYFWDEIGGINKCVFLKISVKCENIWKKSA